MFIYVYYTRDLRVMFQFYVCPVHGADLTVHWILTMSFLNNLSLENLSWILYNGERMASPSRAKI